jgi:predicted RNA-binding Zn ribbon-like protein
VLLQDFLNTCAVGEPDELADPASAQAWLATVGRAGVVDPGSLELAREVRAALRAQLLDGEAAALPEIPLQVLLTDSGPRLAGRGGPLLELVGEALGEALDLRATGQWDRLKACARDSCRWVFFDESRNRSGRWCSMRVCGNREKTAAYRARKH